MVRQQQKKNKQEDVGQTLQAGITRQESNLQSYVRPVYPSWPSSKPGPLSTPPPPGSKPINALRSEQMREVGYNQETGEPAAQSPSRSTLNEHIAESFDQETTTAQDALRRRKKRL